MFQVFKYQTQDKISIKTCSTGDQSKIKMASCLSHSALEKLAHLEKSKAFRKITLWKITHCPVVPMPE